jgi:hypothetical protein
MAQLEKMRIELVERLFKKLELKFDKDEDGDLMARRFEYGGFAQVILAQVNEEFLKFSICAIDKDMPRANWGAALAACNDWNGRTLIGCGLVAAENYDTDPTAKVLFIGSLYATQITEEQLEDFFGATSHFSRRFFTHLSELDLI